MDPHESSSKRSILEVEFIQNQEDRGAHYEEAETVQMKRRKLETSPIKIENIVEKILSFLDFKTIKEVRLVNPLWSSEGAKILLTKCYLKLPSNPQVVESSSSTSNETEKFEAFLSHKSDKRPNIPNIIVNAIGDFELWKSFGVLGSGVKVLKLNFVDDKAELLRDLLHLLPNLSYLDLNDMNIYDDCTSTGTFIKVLSSVLSKEKTYRALLVISRIFLEPESVEILENFENFAECSNIKIEALEIQMYDSDKVDDIPNFRTRMANTLNKLLSSSQNILKKLHLEGSALYLSLLDFPCLTSLSEIDVYFFPKTAEDLLQCKFAPSFRFSEKLPNLYEFGVNFGGCEEDTTITFFTNLFQKTGNARSVKRLSLDSWVDEFDDIDRLFQGFPNIEVFETFEHACSQEVLASLWKHSPKLKELDLSWEQRSWMHSHLVLDCIITGFDLSTVKEIKSCPKFTDAYTVEELDKLRDNPSVLNFKELQRLTVYVQGNIPMDLLAIASQYAFKFMPSDTQIVIDARCGEPTTEWIAAMTDTASKLPNLTFIRRKDE